MERIHINKMPLYRDHTEQEKDIVTGRISGFKLSHLVAHLTFEKINARGQVRQDKAKKAVLRALCDRYPMVYPGEKDIAAKTGYSVAQVRRILRELEHVDKLIVDVNSRITWRKPTAQDIKNGHPAHKLVRECDDVGKKGGRGPNCTPQYHICDRKIYDACQQQESYERAEKKRKKASAETQSSEISEVGNPLIQGTFPEPETRSSQNKTRSSENETRSYEESKPLISEQNPLTVSAEPISINLQEEPTIEPTTSNLPAGAEHSTPSLPLAPKPEEEGGGGYSNGGQGKESLTPSASLAPCPPLTPSNTTKDFGSELVGAYAKAGFGALSLAGLRKVNTLEGSQEEKLRVFGHWLTRPGGMLGLKCPLIMFVTEYPAYYDAMKRYEKRKAAKAANQKRVDESHAATEQWRAELEALKYEGELETWVQQVKDWAVANPSPPYLVVTSDGELARIEGGAERLVSLAVAVAEDRAEEARFRKHIEGFEFCCCERCNPEYWAAKADKEAHDCQCLYADCPSHYSGACLQPAHHHHPGFTGAEEWVCGECAAEFVRRSTITS